MSQWRAAAWPYWAFALLALGPLALAAGWPALTSWVHEYNRPEGYYSHAYAVPFLAALIAWQRRHRIAAAPKRLAPAALWLLVPSLLVLAVGARQYMTSAISVAFLIALQSSLWLLFGGAWVRAAALPLAFLWLMVPLPQTLLNDATLNLQSLSTDGAAAVLRAVGMGASREGNLLHLDSYTLNVDVPCSGFKLLLRLVTFSAAFALLTDLRRGGKATLLAVALPLSVFINSVRIALIGVAGECLGSSAADAFHDWSGWISLALCMAVLFSIAKAMGCRTLAGQPV